MKNKYVSVAMPTGSEIQRWLVAIECSNKMPRAQAYAVDGVGHAPHLENLDQFLKVWDVSTTWTTLSHSSVESNK